MAFSFLLLFVRIACPQPGSSGDETFSANRKFSLEFSEGEANKVLLTVFKHDGEQKSVHWAKSLPQNEQGAPLQFNRRILTDDGRTVLLRAGQYANDQPFLRLIQQRGDPIEFDIDQVSGVTGADFIDENGLSPEQTFELLRDSEQPPLYAVWFEHQPRWLVLDLSKATMASATPTLQTRFDATALARARALIQEHQPSLLKRLLQPVRRTAAQIPGFEQMGAPDLSQLSTELAGAYRFLAAQKNPEDKASIQELLQRKIENLRITGGPFGVPGFFYMYSQERALGDELLSEWENGPADQALDAPGYEWRQKFHYLGYVSGTVRLPFPANDRQGSVQIYLIPDSVPAGKWDNRDDVIVLRNRFNQSPRMPARPGDEEPEGPSQFRFAFGTLTPGAYRLKAVWDHRPPFEPPISKTPNRPADGDYESAESQPFKIIAGGRIENILIHCTNRVGTAEAYFSADERWRAKHPPEYTDNADENPGAFGPAPEVTSFSAGIAGWIIRTNEPNDRFYLTKIRVVQTRQFPDGDSVQIVKVRFIDRERKFGDYNSNFEAVITDEHGCQFRGSASSSSGKWTDIFFNPFPFHARKLSFDLTETKNDSTPRPNYRQPAPERVLSLTLTNLIPSKPDQFGAPNLPARRDLDKVSVELVATTSEPVPGMPAIAGQGVPTQTRFRFFSNNQEDFGWRVESLRFLDRWGNSSAGVTGFCREEKTLKLQARFSRDFELSDFSSDEKWEIPVAKIPGPGEVIPIGQTQEIQGARIDLVAIGGPGEYTYRNGRLLAATNHLTQGRPARNNRQRFPGDYTPSAREPRIYFTDDGLPRYMGPQSGIQNDQVAARVPYLVYRVKIPNKISQCDLLEQTEEAEIANRYNYIPPHLRNTAPYKYAALKFRSGETNRILTFLAQRPREVEFIVPAANGSDESN